MKSYINFSGIISVFLILIGINTIYSGHIGKYHSIQLYGKEADITGIIFLISGLLFLRISYKSHDR